MRSRIRHGDGTTSAPLEAVLDQTGTTALVIVAKGKLVYEHYANGGGRDAVNRCFSVTKSFASALVGIAIGEGRLSGIDQPISEHLPEFAGRPTGELTLRHLLEMRSGIRFIPGPQPWSDDAICYFSPDCRAATRRVPVTDPIGGFFHYNDYHPFLVGMILERVMGKPIGQTFGQRLWQRMGVQLSGKPDDRQQAQRLRSSRERPQRDHLGPCKIRPPLPQPWTVGGSTNRAIRMGALKHWT